ncbi:RsmE family RNA methyltransferase [Balneolales bacterium ANBcel1]|nr:RsmE family RNA methyltransferase [Balneolales bacterium ANBcel1]
MDSHFLFYVPPEQSRSDHIVFPEEEAHHMVRVLRKRAGDLVQVTDGTGNLLEVRLTHADRKSVTGEVISRVAIPPGPDRILAMGVIKQRDRLEFAIEKAVELGASRIVLVHSDHAEKTGIRPSRVAATILSAMKQSRRCHLPAWEERDDFKSVLLDYGPGRQVLMAHLSSEESGLQDPSAGRSNDAPSLLLVGPEGGFSEEEIADAVTAGAGEVSLGSARLRAETAVCALLALLECR